MRGSRTSGTSQKKCYFVKGCRAIYLRKKSKNIQFLMSVYCFWGDLGRATTNQVVFCNSLIGHLDQKYGAGIHGS